MTTTEERCIQDLYIDGKLVCEEGTKALISWGDFGGIIFVNATEVPKGIEDDIIMLHFRRDNSTEYYKKESEE